MYQYDQIKGYIDTFLIKNGYCLKYPYTALLLFFYAY